MKLLIVDNYDSFTYNLVHLVQKVSGIAADVRLNNQITPDEAAGYDKIILSPGPGLPAEAGKMPEILHACATSRSILGVCLGLQAIVLHFGGRLRNLHTVKHGIATPIHIIQPHSLFEGIPDTFMAGRYHSWVADHEKLPAELSVTALDNENEIMAIKHKNLDVCGIQFHPESILSEYGEAMISNWLKK